MIIELSRYVFETLRQDGEFALCRGRTDDGGLSIVLLVAPVSEYPTLGSLERLEHEHTLRDELDSDWAARPLTLVRGKLHKRGLIHKDIKPAPAASGQERGGAWALAKRSERGAGPER